jgi:hypothetical protein
MRFCQNGIDCALWTYVPRGVHGRWLHVRDELTHDLSVDFGDEPEPELVSVACELIL